MNIAWAVFDLVVLSVLFRAVAYQGFEPARIEKETA